MLRKRPRRSRFQQFTLVFAAIGALLFSYYLGNLYQQHTEKQSAILLDQPLPLDTTGLPEALVELLQDPAVWVVLIVGEPSSTCDQLLAHYIEVYNRLAAWPRVQGAVHLVLTHSSSATPPLWQSYDWTQAIRLSAERLAKLSIDAGITPIGNLWCEGVQATAAVIGPGAQVPALLPLDKPAAMAESLRLLINTPKPDA